jgi:hypothetical protein
VFPSASQVRTVVGLTRRADDASSWLMGQAILRNHQIGGIEKDSVGFWCDAKAARKGTPTSDPVLCRAVSAEAGLIRTDEPGLSLIVPHVLPNIEPAHLMAAAWREGENCDTVVLVEFKKPMRDDYTSGRDPVQQVLHYAKRLRSESAIADVKGRAIRGINSRTAFHCYVVADLTPTLDASIIGRFSRTPDGQGYFGYSPDPPAFVEIVPYSKILNDAKIRNTIFFKTLGITSEV